MVSHTYLNVASGASVIEGYINIDNSIFLMLSYYSVFKFIVPKKYHSNIESYVSARKKATVIRRDCRKDLLIYANNSVDHIVCSHFLEHLYPSEVQEVLTGFYRILKNGGTLHLVLPDLSLQIDQYLRNKEKGLNNAADIFITSTEFSSMNKPEWLFKLLTFFGMFGLKHLWMYDYNSMLEVVLKYNFILTDKINTPSSDFKKFDIDAFSIFVKKQT